jgi:hypothetical protein
MMLRVHDIHRSGKQVKMWRELKNLFLETDITIAGDLAYEV